jgi:hypothetical protein
VTNDFERCPPSDSRYGLALRILAKLGMLEVTPQGERYTLVYGKLRELLNLWHETPASPTENGNPSHCSLCLQRFQCKSNSI